MSHTAIQDQNPATIPVPLPQAAHDDAKRFALQQTSNSRAKNAYLRTLAVHAVNRYLRCLNIETDLEASDLWNGLYSNLTDSGNLDLPGIGQLECCPVHPGADSFVPPQLVRGDRLAYIAVQFHEDLSEVELIGYRPILDASQPPDEIFIDAFQDDCTRDDGYSLFPIEKLLDYLFMIRDIRQEMENADDPIIVGIRQQLEANLGVSSEFLNQAIAKARDCDTDLMALEGEKLMNLVHGEQRELATSTGQLNANGEEEGDRGVNEEQRQTGMQFIQWVQRILGIQTAPSTFNAPDILKLIEYIDRDPDNILKSIHLHDTRINDHHSETTMVIPLTPRVFEVVNLYVQGEQISPETRDRIRLNTLAVLVARSYFQRHQIATDVANSDAWEPGLRSSNDVADLPIMDMGRIECRPILPNQTEIELPPETWCDRMGYLLIEINEAAHMASILGFAEPILDVENPKTTLCRDKVRSLDHLHDFLERRQLVKQQIDAVFPDIKAAVAEDTTEQLTTEFTWITMRDRPSQWGRKGIRAVDRHRQESLESSVREVGMLKDAQSSETDALRDRIRHLFQTIEDALENLG